MPSFYNSEIQEYWFDEEEDNYKNKWFQKDKDKLIELDRVITSKFKDKLELCESYDINKWEYGWGGFCGEEQAIEMIDTIICLDQFSRHIYRITNNKEKIKQNTKKASIYANILLGFLEDKFAEEQDITLKKEEIVFILMPLKHDDIYKNFKRIHTFISLSYDLNYLLNTNKDHLVYKFYLDSMKKFYNHPKQYENLIQFDIDSNRKEFDLCKLKMVCEYFPEKEDYEIKINPSDELYKICDGFLKTQVNNKLVVSLSGGPDSMVLLFILSKFVQKYNIILEAIHINYKNRSESDIEEELVQYYCNKLNIRLHVYRFRYIRRKECPREYYEKLTRTVRFNLYKSLNSSVILGHIKDDLIENIWTNISKGKDIFKLHKIDVNSTIENQVILRPFVRVDKKSIFEFAQKANVPYLKNTTPEWSNRGKLRNDFIPAVNKQFGEIDNKLLYLSDTINSYHKILEQFIFDPFFKSISYHKFGLRVNISEFMQMPNHFWQESIIKMFHTMNTKVPTKRSIDNFYDCIQRLKKGVINLSKTHVVYIDNQLNLHILDINMVNGFMRKINLDNNDWQYLILNINKSI